MGFIEQLSLFDLFMDGDILNEMTFDEKVEKIKTQMYVIEIKTSMPIIKSYLEPTHTISATGGARRKTSKKTSKKKSLKGGAQRRTSKKTSKKTSKRTSKKSLRK